MPTKPDGALGSLDFSKAERRKLAAQSRLAPPKFGSESRQRVIQQLHEAMLLTAPPLPVMARGEEEGQGKGGERRGEGEGREVAGEKGAGEGGGEAEAASALVTGARHPDAVLAGVQAPVGAAGAEGSLAAGAGAADERPGSALPVRSSSSESTSQSSPTCLPPLAPTSLATDPTLPALSAHSHSHMHSQSGLQSQAQPASAVQMSAEQAAAPSTPLPNAQWSGQASDLPGASEGSGSMSAAAAGSRGSTGAGCVSWSDVQQQSSAPAAPGMSGVGATLGEQNRGEEGRALQQQVVTAGFTGGVAWSSDQPIHEHEEHQPFNLPRDDRARPSSHSGTSSSGSTSTSTSTSPGTSTSISGTSSSSAVQGQGALNSALDRLLSLATAAVFAAILALLFAKWLRRSDAGSGSYLPDLMPDERMEL